MFGVSLGDLIDHDQLRHDPVMAILAGSSKPRSMPHDLPEQLRLPIVPLLHQPGRSSPIRRESRIENRPKMQSQIARNRVLPPDFSRKIEYPPGRRINGLQVLQRAGTHYAVF